MYLSGPIVYIAASLSFLYISGWGWGILCSLVAIALSFVQRYFFRKFMEKLEHLKRVKAFVLEGTAE